MNQIKYYLSIACILYAGVAIDAQQPDVKTDVAVDTVTSKLEKRISQGYFSQPENTLTGAVETLSGKVFEKTPVAELSLTFPGRFAGLQTIESTSELANASALKLIRGVSTVNGTTPLIVIDGVITPTSYWDYLAPQEIENISILKDGASTALYGMEGAGGAIIITTKRGFDGKRNIEVYAGQAFQQMTKRPKLAGAAEYVVMRNQAAMNDGLSVPFGPNAVNGFTSGNTDLYPDNDWYNTYMRKYAVMQRAGLNIAGGNKNLHYFTNLNYMHQGSTFNIDKNVAGRDYDPTPGVHSLNFRSNIDIAFSNRLMGYLRISGNVDLDKRAGNILGDNNSYIYSSLFRFPPTMYGPVTPQDSQYPNEVVTTSEGAYDPTYGLLNRSGYNQILTTCIMSQAGLKLDMDFITKGLSLSGNMAYQSRSAQTTINSQTFATYIQNAYGALNFTQNGTDENTPLSYPPVKSSEFEYNLNLYANLDYEQRFDDHYFKALAYASYMQQETPEEFYIGWGADWEIYAANVLPYYRQNYGASMTYGFKNRYFIKGDLGYTGSEQFGPGHRYVFTPGISASWIASDEDFLKGNAVLTCLKLRASYGVNANDQLGNTRFMYMDYYNSRGEEGLKGNPDLTAETIKKQNYGFDLGLRDMLTVHFDYFSHRTDNMLISGAGEAPLFSGIKLDNYPKLNKGVMTNHGFEASVLYNKRLGKDLQALAGIGLAYNKNKVISANEAARGEGYAYQYLTEGFSVGQQFGYLIDKSNGNGYINTAEELAKATAMYKFGSQPRLGDFMYQDISGDGLIDDKDYAPIGHAAIPRINYNFTFGLDYKNFEVNLLFQGTAKSSTWRIGNEYVYPGIYTDFEQNAWTAERYAAGEKIGYPALSYATASASNGVANDFFLVNNSYLRLRNLELAYTLPVSLSNLISAKSVRVAFNAQNLLTFDKMPSKYVDPETGSLTTFQPFRVYNIALNIKF
ncbi:MAG: SusC/RagA family TonB-linked outer membrane protein [Tannerella sp.]|jgi:TonB-linked SusC/RagA family outer membrane protein|nr:SusC/RagA family TonB-linked outer membrane protein [Tannerella sp.]